MINPLVFLRPPGVVRNHGRLDTHTRFGPSMGFFFVFMIGQ
jgi:hypothetical protein